MKLQIENLFTSEKVVTTGILLLILLLLAFLLINTSEGFQINKLYNKRQNLEDLRYFISLGLNPLYNDSYKYALDDYRTYNGVDYFDSDDAISKSAKPKSSEVDIKEINTDLDTINDNITEVKRQTQRIYNNQQLELSQLFQINERVNQQAPQMLQPNLYNTVYTEPPLRNTTNDSPPLLTPLSNILNTSPSGINYDASGYPINDIPPLLTSLSNISNTTLAPSGPRSRSMSNMSPEGLLAYYSIMDILRLEENRNFISNFNQQFAIQMLQFGVTQPMIQAYEPSVTSSLYSQGVITANNWVMSNLPLTNNKVPLAINESINFIRNNTPLLNNQNQSPLPPLNFTEAQMSVLQQIGNRIPELNSPSPPFDPSLGPQWIADLNTFVQQNPNFTLDQLESFIRNWITSNGGTLAPRSPDLPPLIESFVNIVKKNISRFYY